MPINNYIVATEPLGDLADKLIEKAPAGLDRVYYVSGGSEAVEAAIKMARRPGLFCDAGAPPCAPTSGMPGRTARRSEALPR